MKNSLRKLEQEDTEAVYRMKEREAYQQVLNNINLGYIDPIKLIEMIFDEGLITLEEIERVIGAIRYAASGEGGRIEL